MRRGDGFAHAPGGDLVPLRYASSPEEVGVALKPGVIVETDLESAEACGAWFEDADSAEIAFEAAEDPSDFPEGALESHGPA